ARLRDDAGRELRGTDAFAASAGGRMLLRRARRASHDQLFLGQLLPAAFRRCRLASISGVMSATGRISNPVASKTMAGGLDHNAIASFRSFASIIPTPPNCSFVSTKGPSVTDTLPFFIRTLTAALASSIASPLT